MAEAEAKARLAGAGSGRLPGARFRMGRYQRVTVAGVAAAAAVLLATVAWHPRPILVWNASPSSPVGLYWVAPVGPRTGDIILAWPPAPVRRLAARRLYLPAGVPLVKPVAAVAGDRVCARGAVIFVNGRAVAARQRHDPRGRWLPWWSGCHALARGELLLLSRTRPLAFDGRYFGITRGSDVIGRAHLLWAR